MSFQDSAGSTARPANRFRWLMLVICLGLVSYFWYWRKQQQQSQNDDQETAYRSPQVVQPIVVPEELVVATQPPKRNMPSDHPLDTALQIAQEIREHLQSEVFDYTATLVKRERIKGKLGKEEHMEVKIRNPRGGGESRVPLSVYLKFIPPSSTAGREVIWVDGKDNGQLHSYQFGIPVSIDPNSALAMMGNKYPITEIGILRMAERLIEKGKRDRELGSCKVEIFEDQTVAGRACRLIQVTHDNRHPQFDFHIAQVYIDKELRAPIRYAAYLWPESASGQPPLEEEYTYSNLKLNVGLTDIDFDRENPEYHFP